VNVKEYISSGVIESYVLGLASDTERQEFEAACAQYPEVAEARDRFERQLESSLLADAPAPPTALKARISAALDAEPALPVSGDGTYEGPAPVRRIDPWKWIAAACALLAAASLYWTFSLNSRLADLGAGTARVDSLEQQLQASRGQLAEYQQELSTLQKPGMKFAALNGLEAAPQSKVMVFWDSTSKDVYMMVQNLPRPATDKQYQLWALLDGKPVDLGAFELRQDRLLLRAKGVQNAQAFAITLEPRGGSPAPTGSMYVYGKL
jgi:anti-sigma-K factor RskA